MGCFRKFIQPTFHGVCILQGIDFSTYGALGIFSSACYGHLRQLCLEFVISQIVCLPVTCIYFNVLIQDYRQFDRFAPDWTERMERRGTETLSSGPAVHRSEGIQHTVRPRASVDPVEHVSRFVHAVGDSFH